MVRGASVWPMNMLAANAVDSAHAGAHHFLHQERHGAHQNLHDAEIIQKWRPARR